MGGANAFWSLLGAGCSPCPCTGCVWGSGCWDSWWWVHVPRLGTGLGPTAAQEPLCPPCPGLVHGGGAAWSPGLGQALRDVPLTAELARQDKKWCGIVSKGV